MFIFVFKNYSKFLCIPLEHFKKYKPLSIAEEPLHELLMLSNTYPTPVCPKVYKRPQYFYRRWNNSIDNKVTLIQIGSIIILVNIVHLSKNEVFKFC